jgi:coiled-coil domain-containing protein 130
MAEWGAPKYYPPDWEPKHGSINKYRGVHALRERARKLKTEGILIIRFEMPFNIWCSSCNDMIGKGTRFNAEKSHDGDYHSTKIYKFAMKCAKCKNKIVMHTDPQNCDYVVTSGGERKEERFEFDEKNDHVASFTSADELEKLQNNAMAKLEHLKDDYTKSLDSIPVLTEIQQIRDQDWRSDYDVSSLLRKRNREQKLKDKAELEYIKKKFGNDFVNEEGDGVTLSKETEGDRALAKEFVFRKKLETKPINSIFQANAKQAKMKQIHGAIITARLQSKKRQSNSDDFTNNLDVIVKKRKIDKKTVSSLSLLQAYKT